MLREVTATGYRPQDVKRRWFRSESADLYVWADGEQGITAFEYCYRDLYKEHHLKWDSNGGFSHARIDDGEPGPFTNQSPIVIPNGEFNMEWVARHFRDQGLSIDGDVYRFVLNKFYEELADDAGASAEED